MRQRGAFVTLNPRDLRPKNSSKLNIFYRIGDRDYRVIATNLENFEMRNTILIEST